MAAKGYGGAEQAEAEARGGGGAEPMAEAGGGHGGLTEDGAERKGRVSGQLSSRLPVLFQRGGRRAEQRYRPSRPAAASSLVDGDSRQPSRGPGEESGDAYDKKQDEDREAPLSAAAMLNIFRSIPTQMDYKGQKLAEQIFQGIILVSAIIGFIYGYITEQFGWTVYIVMAGFALSCLLTLPPWPMYRRNPLKWLPVQESGTEEKKPADRKPKRHAKS
ncbi:signal peptidase complex subunit 1 [Harpia harpyja]|uniref:signal peptidase complex subunit 1 n=1 Tax=Harpia harpyja TaxID=202280 RepID=UPI0022B11BDC|nr:signal peptidase complex subunit 1 [Harpia harpyja]